ncbi:MAG TPA: LEPR-XLL domain-containing protein [Burkholderiaceae bacterium]|nr:LEPR-XLL domain-containing protein [Burkholderiaceae bacterium]
MKSRFFRKSERQPRALVSRLKKALAGWSGSAGGAAQEPRRRVHIEPIEPRVLLSVDLLPAASYGLADGIDALGDRMADFLVAEDLLGDRVPILLKAGKDTDGNPVYEAPTVLDLLSVRVDANLDGVNGLADPSDPLNFNTSDDDEGVLAGLDKDLLGQPGHGVVDPGEFLQAWFFEPFANYLDLAPLTTGDVKHFLEDGILLYFSPEKHLDHLSGSSYVVDFKIVDAKVDDTTENPDAEFTFKVGFELTITQMMAIDLGLEADALKLLAFTGEVDSNPGQPKVPVTSKLSFAFDFGIHTGGQSTAQINALDFFVRKAEPIVASVKSDVGDIPDFHLNIGFLGADVIDGSLKLQADVETALLDPNDPDVLGFTDDQHGVEQASGSVVAANALSSANLSHAAGFFLRIGNLGISTPVTVPDNNADGDPLSAVVADVDAALVAAGLGDLVEVSLDGSDKLRFDVVATTDTPLGFGNDVNNTFGVLQATPDGTGGNIWEFTADQNFLLSVGGALPKLVTVRGPDPSHTQIGFNNGQSAAATAVVAPAPASVFDISADANFTVTVKFDDGTEASASFTLSATDTDGNTDAGDLAADIDAGMLANPAVWGVVQVVADGSGHIRFNPLGGTVSAIRVQASGTATSEVGLAGDATATRALTAASAATADLADPARFKLTLKTDTGASTSTATVLVVVPDYDRASLADLAGDINAAIDAAVGANRIDATVVGGKIVLKALDADVLAFSVVTINESLADLVGDVNQALAEAGLGGQVTASEVLGQLRLATTGGQSLEISRRLTFDAGVTFAELVLTPTAQLFDAAEGSASTVQLKLPVSVLPGLEDAKTPADDDFRPAHMAIVGNFDPFNSAAATFVDGTVNRFDLHFTYEPTVSNQDSPKGSVPGVGSLSNTIVLNNFAEALNFSLISAESMIGLIGSLGTALQQLSNTEKFTDFGIPFAEATLSDLLNFADEDKARYSGLIDMLLFDTGGDGIDGSAGDANRLLKKVTVDSTSYLLPAFSTAQTLGAKLKEVLGTPTLEGAGAINPTYNWETNELTYQVDLHAGARTAVSTQLPVVANGAGFDDDINRVRFEHDVAFDPFDKLTIDTARPPAETSVDIKGRTGLGMTFGVNLSPPGAVIFNDTPLASLNGLHGIDARIERALTGETGVRSIYGITRDSTFKISVDGGTARKVDLAASATNTNLTIGNLVSDLQAAINAALSGTPDAGKIVVGLDAATLTRLGMQHVDAGHTFQIYVESSDPFVTELGFANLFTSGVPTAHEVFIAQKAAPLLVGRLSGVLDATFEIDILKNRDGTVNGAPPVPVSISVAATAGNVSPADLVADVNNALAAAGLLGTVTAAFDNSTSQGTRLVLVAGDNDPTTPIDDTKIEFTVRATNSKAHTELGLPNVATAANRSDFVIFDTAGVAHEIVLDPTGLDRAHVAYNPLNGLPNDPTVGDLIAVINAYFPDPVGPDLPLVVASLNSTHTGLKLVHNGPAGTQQFRVETINDSGALVGIGLFLTGDDALPDTFGDGDPNLIEGGSISLTQLNDRFFVRDAQLRIDGLTVKTPDAGVPGEGLYGIVGVDVNVKGRLDANVTANLVDPGGPGVNRITLAELLAKEGVLAAPVVSKQTLLNYDGLLSGAFTVGGLLLGSNPGDSAVIVGVDGATLRLANVKGTFSDDEYIGQTPATLAQANGTTAAAASYGSFDLTVKVQPGFDDLGFDADFAALDDAPYVLPFQMTGLDEPFSHSALNLALLGNLQPLDKLSYEHIAAALANLQGMLEDVDTNFAALNVELPAIQRSVGGLLGLVDGFANGVGNADAVLDSAIAAIGPEGMFLPALRLQDLPRALRGAFGLPVGVNPSTAGAVDWVRLDLDVGAGEVLMSMNMHEALSTKLGLDIVTGATSPNLTSAGVLEVSGTLDMQLDVAIDLATPSAQDLLESTRIAGSLHVQGEGQEYAGGEDGLGLVFRAALGPLAVFVQDGDVLIDYAFSLDRAGKGRVALDADAGFNDFNAPLVSKDKIDIVLPMFYGGEGPDDFIGEFKAIGTVASNTVTRPNFGPIVADITTEVVPYDPFENILLAIDTLDLYLETLSDQLSSDVLGIQLPFVGDQLGDVLFIEDFRSTLVRTLKNGIENSVNPDPDTKVTDLLQALFVGGALNGYLVGTITNPKDVAPTTPPGSRYRQWNFTVAHSDTIIVDDFDIGPDHLGFDVNAPLKVTFDWSIELAFGVDFENGAYILVSDADELNLDLTIKLPTDMDTTAYTGQLGFLQLKVKDPGEDSGVQLHFVVDVKDGSTSDPKLGFSELGSNLNVEATLQGDSLPGAFEGRAATFDLRTTQTYGLPVLSTQFIFDWAMPTAQSVASLDGDAVTDFITRIELRDMELDALSGIKELLGEPFEKIAAIIEPFMPVIDLLTAPIPVLSDLAGEPFTLLDLAEIFGEVDADFIEAVADILDVINTVGSITSLPVLPLGDFVLFDSGAGADYFDPAITAKPLGADEISLLTAGLAADVSGFNAAIETNDFLTNLRDQTLVPGLTMPIFESPLEGIRLLIDRDADLVKYELPELGVSFEYLQVFPVWGPLAVSIEISFGFDLDLHAVGYDTYGYRRFAEGGFRNGALLFDGFFLADGETKGTDDPEITFEFGLVGAAELNIGIARAGVGGGIDAVINFDWHDSVPDGNIHASEIIGNIIAENGNPLAPFDVSGELTFELFAFLEISLLGIDEKFPITGKQTLFSFNENFDRNPLLGDVQSGTLFLSMGPNAEDRLNGDKSDGHEEFYLRRVGDDQVKVWSPNLGVDESEGKTYSGVSRIVGLGGEGDDKFVLYDFDKYSGNITGEIEGGVGDDTVQFNPSNAAASVDAVGWRISGGLGNDKLWGSHLNDTIIGGDGNDDLKGAGGYDLLFGDNGRNADSATPKFISARIGEDDGDDTIDGGAEDDVVIGAGGNDTLRGGAGNDLIIGDGGRFDYTMSGNHIDIASLRPAAYVPTPVSTPKDPDLISAEIDVLLDAVLDTIRATDLGFGGNDTIFGDAGNDLVLGGSGDDTIRGNAGDDLLLGGKGFDDIQGGAENDTIFGNDQADTLDGNTGDDVMSGGAGNDFMHGNEDNDVMKGDTGADVMFGDAGDDQVFGQTEPDVLFGGLDDDLVVGGSSNDIMFGDDGLVAKIDSNLLDGDQGKVIGIGSAALLVGQYRDNDIRTLDLIITDVVAGDGNDMMSGDAGDDIMLGGGGNDLMGGDVDPRLASFAHPTEVSDDVMVGDGGRVVFDQRRFRTINTVLLSPDPTVGTPFDDVIYGDNGNDYIFGGQGGDALFGGHGKVVASNVPPTAPTLGSARGATEARDNDIIVGDNGQMDFADGTTPANFGRLELVKTTDTSNATGGREWAEGQLGNDVVIGGVNGSVDVLFGNEGSDVVIGDNGELDFALGTDTNLDTLDLIRSYRDGLGGIDIVSGNAGDDVLIGGTAGDTMYGDSDGVVFPLSTTTPSTPDGEDIMLGDNGALYLIGTVGRLKVQVASMSMGTAVDLITTTDDIDVTAPIDPNFDTVAEVNAVGGADTMSGNAGADIIIGGVNGSDPNGIDRLYGDRAVPLPDASSVAADRDDILIGDNALLDFTFDSDPSRDTLDLIRSFEDGLGGKDELSGNRGADVGIGGTGDDVIFGDDVTASAGSWDLGDMLLGDNADIFLVAAGSASGGDLKKVLGSAVKTIRTTDEEHPEYGGRDTISGNAGGDIIAGGVKGDLLYGDALATVPTLDGNDIMLGDNAAFEWLSTGRLSEISGIDIGANNPALWTKYGGGVTADTDLTTLDLITTEQPTKGGRDTMYGDEGNDLMFGGTDVDVMRGDDGDGDYETSKANTDLMFGDHGRVYPQFSYVGVRNLLGVEVLALTPDFPSRNYFAIDIGASLGGQGDVMYGEEGDDVMLGQQGDDRMWGGLDDDDMIGGHNVAGGVDELAGAIAGTLVVEDAPDVGMNDLMDGDEGDDAMAGDNAIVWRRGDDLSPRFRLLTDLDADGSTLDTPIYSTTDGTITVNVGAASQSDPANAIGRDIELLDHSDAVEATPLGRFGKDVMAGGSDNDVMYGQLGDDLMQGDGSIDEAPYPVYAGLPMSVLREIVVVDGGEIAPDPDLGQTLRFAVPEQTSDGDDYMEGNGGRDLMYGGLGQDDMLGGSSALFGLTTNAMRPDDSDTMYGGAGIDLARNGIGDAVTVSETVDGKTSTNVIQAIVDGHARDADYMMGDNANVLRVVTTGDAFRTFLHDSGGTTDPDDYDGTVRIVPRAMQQLDYTLGGSDRAGDKAGKYVNGAADLDSDGSADDNGAADLVHGESGDDIIFGMTGSDVLFGEGQNDDIVGGYGHDWISGGTGQDGVLGDDGLIFTSRNSTSGEPLYGIAGLLGSDADTRYSNGNALDEPISTPGGIQTAVINRSGELKKTVDLVPFSVDAGWLARDDEYPDNQDARPYADDIIFGGWGSDWLHGGSGDDAISGAEALVQAYVPAYDNTGARVGLIDLGYANVGIANALVVNPTQQNPGNVLFFHPEDTDGQHLNNRFRAGEFDLYDEYNPRVKILLDGTGSPTLDGTGSNFLLNFRAPNGLYDAGFDPLTTPFEGVRRPAGTVPKATGQQTESYPVVDDDGADAIFGDLGNDWLVGGTGRDNVYGGWGNDLLQVDDYLDTETTDLGPQDDIDARFDNEKPDTHPTYEDRAYGGAGRDVLIGNTGGDRLIDWVGEYNSYIVPYAPFGQASVSRTLQPYLPEFLYALSAGDGADPTRYRDAVNTGTPPAPTNNNPIPTRFGEPHGELGLVLQKDFAWGDQTGAPADPQAGNIPGGPRDVLRSATFAGNNADGFVAASGTWTVTNNAYEVAPLSGSSNKDAISLFNSDVTVPSYFEITATINALKPVAGFKANAYIVFDYYGPTDFKFAGINISTNKIEIGQRTASGFQVQASKNVLLKAGSDYNVLVAINGTAVTLVVNNSNSVSFSFTPRVDGDGFTYGINAGMYGLGADNAKARIDNVVVQRIPPKVTMTLTDEFTGTAPALLTPFGAGWSIQSGRLVGTAASGAPFALASNDIAVSAASSLQLSATLSVAGQGGIVFDMYSPTDFKWAAVSAATNQVLLGHYTAKAGWVVDAAVSRTVAAGDATLSITLRGTTAVVSLNGQQVLSRIYNANVVDGGVGLFSRAGVTSFDSFTLATDDPKFAPPTEKPASAAAPTGTLSAANTLAAPGAQSSALATGTTAAAAAASDPVPARSAALAVARSRDMAGATVDTGVARGAAARADAERPGALWATWSRRPAIAALAPEAATVVPVSKDGAPAAGARDAAAGVPVIDWSLAAAARTSPAAQRTGAEGWYDEFLNDLGRKRGYPNSKLRVVV